MIARAVLALLVATSTSCAGRAWKYDESDRIDEVMRGDPFHPDMPGARGIALYGAPPMAAPWRPGEGYQINRSRQKERRPRYREMDASPPRARRGRAAQVRATRSRSRAESRPRAKTTRRTKRPRGLAPALPTSGEAPIAP